jgi:hypothetical protein
MRRYVVVALAVSVAACAPSVEGDRPDEPQEPSGGGAGGAGPRGGPGPSGQGGGSPGAGGAGATGGGGAGTGTGAGGAGGGSTPAGDAGRAAGADAGAPPGSGDGGGGAGGAAADENAYLQQPVPVLLVNVGGRTIIKDTKIDGTLKVIEDRAGAETVMGGTTLVGIETRPATLEARIGIEIRGNSSSGFFAQKPYGFEVRDATGAGLAVPLLGLPREADFVLHSCYGDKSCMRNALTYAMGREIAVPAGRWAPRTRWVELVIDGRYQGTYLLVEKIKRDRGRVVLPEPAADANAGDLTGGYIWSAEGNRNKGARTWPDALNTGRFWAYRFPNYRELTEPQRMYLQGAVASFQRRIMANPRWSEVKKFVDAPSWIDYLVMQEVTNNTDAFFASWYFYKQPDAAGGKVFMGPYWDFDIAYGNVNHGYRVDAQGPYRLGWRQFPA